MAMKKKQTLEQWCAADPRSVAEQAEYLGLSEAQYWRWRTGSARKPKTAERLAELTGIPATVLLGLEKA